MKTAAIAACAVALAGCNRFATTAQLSAVSAKTAAVEQRVEALQKQLRVMADERSGQPSWVLWRQQIDTRPGVVYAQEPRWRAMAAYSNKFGCGLGVQGRVEPLGAKAITESSDPWRIVAPGELIRFACLPLGVQPERP